VLASEPITRNSSPWMRLSCFALSVGAIRRPRDRAWLRMRDGRGWADTSTRPPIAASISISPTTAGASQISVRTV
jgi:hypothetical protein